MPIVWTIFILMTLFIAVSSFMVYASTAISSGVYLKAYCRAKTSAKILALSFDDGPHPVQTPKVLEILKKHQIKAVFFLIGKSAQRHPEIVRTIIEEGHLIGNHTFTHANTFPLLKRDDMEKELELCESTLYEITHQRTKLFRPPFGVTNPTIGRAVKRLGYKTIGWSIRSLDTRKEDRTTVLARVVKKAHPGGIILLHDNRTQSDLLTERIIEELILKGFEFKRVDELLEF